MIYLSIFGPMFLSLTLFGYLDTKYPTDGWEGFFPIFILWPVGLVLFIIISPYMLGKYLANRSKK